MVTGDFQLSLAISHYHYSASNFTR